MPTDDEDSLVDTVDSALALLKTMDVVVIHTGKALKKPGDEMTVGDKS